MKSFIKKAFDLVVRPIAVVICMIAAMYLKELVLDPYFYPQPVSIVATTVSAIDEKHGIVVTPHVFTVENYGASTAKIVIESDNKARFEYEGGSAVFAVFPDGHDIVFDDIEMQCEKQKTDGAVFDWKCYNTEHGVYLRIKFSPLW